MFGSKKSGLISNHTFYFLLLFGELAQELGVAVQVVLLLAELDLLAAELGQQHLVTDGNGEGADGAVLKVILDRKSKL